ncbi:protein AATF-like [Actinia tenebrosa]|uniref:Protein AATF-like n=1 Tax=Actinia tenebrosa TaxID=6105 RepID=A0A6P8HZ48_ACTTE|nr:protein AATF-like [Actinia tenebrosa]
MASIAEQIRSLSRPEPTHFDPEEDDFDITRAKLVSKDDNEELDGEKLDSSSLRKKNIALLADEDSKYHGRPVSRGEIARMRGDFQDSDESLEDDEEDDSDEREEIESDDDDGIKEKENREESNENEKDVEDDDDDEDDSEVDCDDSDEDDDDVENGRGLNDEEEEGRGIDSFSSSRREDEIEKGIAVKQQLSLWDSILEYRIRIQKAMMLANKLPQSDNINVFTSSNDINLKSVKDKERKSLMDFLYKLLKVQEKLLEGNPETRSILHPGNKNGKQDSEDDEEIPSDSEGEDEKKKSDEEEEESENIPSLKLPAKRKRDLTQEELSECITKRHAAFQSYRDSVISKWSEKTRLASGKLSSKSFSAFDKSALTQIKQILSDKPRLIRRTQLKRSSYRVLGKTDKDASTGTETEEQANAHLKDYDSEIFDDDDFYHQLLRELIERRTTTNTDDPIEMGRQWLELQKLRRKIKKKIDTKASKGRKLRYNVHSKLEGYMPPIETGTMPDSSRNELFSSLFGQSKTQTEIFDLDVFR